MSRENHDRTHHLKHKEDANTLQAGVTEQRTTQIPGSPSHPATEDDPPRPTPRNNPTSPNSKPRARPRETAPQKGKEEQEAGEAVDQERQLSLPPGSDSSEGATGESLNTDINKITEALAAGISSKTEGNQASLSTTLKDFLPKLLQVDLENKKLKETVTYLEGELAKTEAVIRRSKATSTSGPAKDEKKVDNNDEILRLEEEYIKMKRKLRKALDANQGWNDYCKDQLNIHLKQLQTKDEQNKQLKDQLTTFESQKDTLRDLQRQLKESQDHLAESKSETELLLVKNSKLEEEQRQVRKLAKGLMKEKDDLRKEVDTLKEEIASAISVSRVSESAESIPTEESIEAKTSSDSGTALSYPLRNVETVMNVEQISAAEKGGSDRGDGEHSAIRNRGELDTASSERDMTTPSDDAGEIITFLQEQVQQYRDDFVNERRDRERAVGELDKVRKELENTKLLLHQTREAQHKKKAKKSLFGGKLKTDKSKSPPPQVQPEPQSQPQPQTAGFRFLGPEEVSELQRRPEPRTIGQLGNQYQEDEDNSDPTNHVYHEIDD